MFLVVFAESIEASCKVENEDIGGAAPPGDAPTKSWWSKLLLPSNAPIIIEVWRYVFIVCTSLVLTAAGKARKLGSKLHPIRISLCIIFSLLICGEEIYSTDANLSGVNILNEK